MATLTGLERDKQQYTGEAGNQLTITGYHKFQAAAGATDNVELCTIPAGSKLYNANIAWTAHGGTGTLSFGWKYKDGSTGGSATAFFAAASSVSAGNNTVTFIPNVITAVGSSGNATGVFDKDVIVYVTSAATAPPANMEIFFAAEGEFKGTL